MGKRKSSNSAPPAANDNVMPANDCPALHGGDQIASGSLFVVRVSLPERLPVLESEVFLLEAYLSDLIGAIIANDN